jgi:hypothetical protein
MIILVSLFFRSIFTSNSLRPHAVWAVCSTLEINVCYYRLKVSGKLLLMEASLA